MRDVLNKSPLLSEVRETCGGLGLAFEAIKFAAVIPVIERLCDRFPRYVISHGIEPLASLDGIWLVGMGLIAPVALVYLALWENMRPRHAGVRLSPQALTVRGFASGYVVGALIMTSAVLLASALGGFELTPNLAQADLASVVLVAVLYVFQAFGEEVLYRGACMMSMARRSSALAAVAVSSLYFSLHHHFNAGYGPVAFVNLFLLAVLLAVTVLMTGRIWMATAIHAAWNFFQGNVWGINVSGGAPRVTSTLMLSVARDVPLITGGEMGLEGSLVTTAVLLVVLGVLAWACRTVTARPRSDETLRS